MSDVAIRVEGLSKSYQITRTDQPQRYKTLQEDLLALPRKLLRTFKQPEVQTFWALNNISFEVKQGEVLGIIGRNGAGKSTLLKVLSRITEPTSGRAEIYGRIGSLLEVGTGFHPELTGRENIYLNGAILGMRRNEIVKHFDEIVDFAEVEKFIDTPVKRYSSGMYMRLAFAVAAYLEPEILIVDEVLAVGDAEFQKKCLGKMGEVASSGRTVLFVSHQMNAVETLCMSVLLLDKGTLKYLGKDVGKTIKNYLFGGSADNNPNEWLNTENEFANRAFNPIRFCITDSLCEVYHSPASNDSDIWIHIEAEIEELDQELTVGYAIYSNEGYLLYWSYQTDGVPDKWPKLQKGQNILRSKIPKRFLNEGTYKIELIGGLHFKQWLFEPGVNAPSIYLTIQGGLSDSPFWIIGRPGAIAPIMDWRVKNESN
jgi:lipopolysaccharide transport system ATP-binding protein